MGRVSNTRPTDWTPAMSNPMTRSIDRSARAMDANNALAADVDPAARMRDLIAAASTSRVLSALAPLADGRIRGEEANIIAAVVSAELVKRIRADHGDLDAAAANAAAMAHAKDGTAALAAYWRALPVLTEGKSA